MSTLGPRTVRRPRLARALDAVRRATDRRSALSDARSVVPAAMASLPEQSDSWSIERASHGGGGISGFLVRTRTGDRLMVKVSRTEAGQASLDRATEAQRTITDIEALGPWRARLPMILGDGRAGTWRFVVESALPGRPLALPALNDPGWDAALQSAVGAIEGLHRATASTDPTLDRRELWVDRRIAAAAALGAPMDRHEPGMGRSLVAGLERIGRELGAVLDREAVAAGWIHGDYWSANILVAGPGDVSGIVDWDSAGPDESAAHDVFHLVLYARKLRRRVALGAVVAELLGGGALDARELAVLERAAPPALGLRTMALLYWLRFVESNVRRQPVLATSERWLASNVAAVVPWL